MRKNIALSLMLTFSLPAGAVEPITPIPQNIPHDTAKAALGKKLFFDPILSKDRTVACVSCHNLQHGGADSRTYSKGVKGRTGRIQSPTVFNAVFNFTQFWNGRAKNLNDQAGGPIHSPLEMGMETDEIESRLNDNSHYRTAFHAVTGRPKIVISDITEMIAEYEKTLITPNSKFDRFLRGEARLDSSEMRGYETFKRLGCASCHNGVNVGGNSFQKFGVIIPMQRAENTDDRYSVTKRENDKNVFKVPTLRNIVLTAPYFHNGNAATLKEALNIMAKHNLGMKLSSHEVNDIIAFLGTLTGELPLKAIQP